MANDPVAKITDPLEEIGSTGLKHQGGKITEEYHPHLRGKQAYAIYNEMLNDAVGAAIMNNIEMRIRQVQWWTTPAEDTASAKAVAEFVEGAWEDMAITFSDLVSMAVDYVPKGFAAIEAVYKKRGGRTGEPTTDSKFNDGKIGWRKFSPRSQETIERWEFDENGEVLGIWQKDPYGAKKGEIYIPIERLLLFNTATSKGNPEGKSILRPMYRSWFLKKNLEELEASAAELDLTGLKYFEAPAKSLVNNGQETQFYKDLKEISRSLHNNEQKSLIFLSDRDDQGNKLYDFKLVASPGSNASVLDGMIRRHAQYMVNSVGASFILTGQNGTGSYALRSDETNSFTIMLGTILETLESVFNNSAIPMLLKENGFDLQDAPYMEHGDIEKTDTNETVKAIVDAVNANVIPVYPALSEYLQNFLDLPPDDGRGFDD